MNAWTLVALSPFLLLIGFVYAPTWTIVYLCGSGSALAVFWVTVKLTGWQPLIDTREPEQ